MTNRLDPYIKKAGNVIHRNGVALPWKANGATIDPKASLDDWMKESGTDFEVVPVPSLYQFNDELRTVPNRVQLIRTDTGESLSQVSGNTYKIHQPKEILEFFRNLVESNQMQMDLVGQMQEGRKIFALASTGEEAEIGKGSGDVVKANVFLIGSFDCSHATKARAGVERLFCLNQIENPFGSSFANRNAVRRKHSQHFVADEVQLELAAINESFAAFVERANAFTKVKMTQDMTLRFLTKLYAPDAFDNPKNWRKSKFHLEDATTNKQNVIADVLNTMEDNLGHALASAHGSLWGALNAVTFYHDHQARTKGNKRWESAMIGQGNARKSEALQLALEIIN